MSKALSRLRLSRMASKNSRGLKILWSIDAFDSSKETLKAQRHLWKFLKKRNWETKVVYVATSAEREVATAFGVTLEERYSIYPREALQARLKAAGISLRDQDVQVISEPGFSLTAAVDRVAWKAEDSGADLLVAFTHSRKGPKRWMLGSFVETLLHRSKTPMLLVNPKTALHSQVKRILLADDLSSKSQAPFEKVLEFAAKFGSELILFHAAQPIYEFSLAPGDPAVSRYRARINRAIEKRERAAAAAKVPLKVLVDSTFSDVADRLQRLAVTERADLLAVQAKTGVMGASLLGSVSRRVIREAALPVLVLK